MTLVVDTRIVFLSQEDNLCSVYRIHIMDRSHIVGHIHKSYNVVTERDMY